MGSYERAIRRGAHNRCWVVLHINLKFMAIWMVEECKMPDLADLEQLKPALLAQVMGGEPGLSLGQRLARRNFVRLIDKAASEYQRSRQTIVDQVQESQRPAAAKGERVLDTLAFTDYFETCINAISRLLKQLERMKATKANFPIDKLERKLVESYSSDLQDIRDGIEHMDEWIQKDKVLEGQTIMLAISDNGEGAVFGKYCVKFEDVAKLIRRLHEISSKILGSP